MSDWATHAVLWGFSSRPYLWALRRAANATDWSDER